MRPLFFDVLMLHASMYPKMEASDYVKLAYQSEFGCGHLLTDRETAYQRFLDEWETVSPNPAMPLTVDIGGGYARFNLAAAKASMSPDLVFAMFENSITRSGTSQGFLRKIQKICRASAFGVIPCQADEIAACAEALGNSIPSHSEQFRRIYGANYRVITKEMATIAPICQLISDLLRQKDHVNVSIEGRAASGKTTTAKLIASIFDATVISMDDYFLPLDRKTEERLAIPGGNIDAERFEAEILSHCHEDNLTHCQFDCHNQVLLKPINEKRKAVLLVEGVYSFRPDFRKYYDVAVLLKTDEDTQRLRILDRGGEELLHRYITEWMPLEETYFQSTSPQVAVDLVVST